MQNGLRRLDKHQTQPLKQSLEEVFLCKQTKLNVLRTEPNETNIFPSKYRNTNNRSIKFSAILSKAVYQPWLFQEVSIKEFSHGNWF